MSDASATPASPATLTVQLQPPPARSVVARVVFALLIVGSFTANVFFCLLFSLLGSSEKEEDTYPERFLYGTRSASDKVAVVRVAGVLVEGMINYPLKQIERAMKDDHVKAVVLRIDSPGGTISASEELHKHLTRMRDGKSPRLPDAKPKRLVASMGTLAASGGYYIAMPAEQIFAEPTTLTGSIGVYASLPNVAELAHKAGFHMELIKAGAIKASGSPFHELSPQERQPWQDMVDHAYDRFLTVVAAGRPRLTKAALRSELLFEREIVLHDEKGNVLRDWWGVPRKTTYSRYRADGGTFSADEARQYGLIDAVGDQEDAVAAVAASAGLGSYKVVAYDRPPSLLSGLLGLEARNLASGLTARLWYLAPGADLAGIVTAARRE